MRLRIRWLERPILVALLLTPLNDGGRFLIPELAPDVPISLAPDSCVVDDFPASALTASITQLVPGSGPTGTLKFMIRHVDNAMGDDTLYVFATVSDAFTTGSLNPDRVVLMFDLVHDHAAGGAASWVAANDRGIRVDRSGNVTRVYGTITNPTTDENATAFPDSRKCIISSDPSYAFKLKLIPADLGLNAFNSLMGAAVLASDFSTNTAVNGRWPATATTTLSTWANVLTRQPIDFVLLADQSGSMMGGKWTSLKQAGDNFALVLSKTKDNIDAEYVAAGVAGGGDRLGLAQFHSSFGSNQSGQVVALNDIPANPGAFTGALPTNPSGGTPIAGGINATFAMFGGAPTFPAPRTRAVMLLSDGMHNVPSTTINFTTQGVDLNYLPSPCGANSLVRINTVAVGTDATVDVTKLNQIKNCYAGSTFTEPDGATVNTYNTADPSEGQLTAQLTRFFAQTIVPYYQWNTINETGANFTINNGDRKILLFAFWNNKGDAVNLTVTRPDASTATGSSSTALGYSWLVVDNPAQGNWTNFVATGAAAKYVFVDLRVRGDFAVDNRRHGTGNPVLLRARLRERGLPVTGANVRVDVARPGEGFGTYVSTHRIGDCRRRAPTLPPPRRTDTRTAAAGVIAPVATAPVQASAGDTLPPRFALISALFQQCGKNGLNRLSDPGLQLFDDGSHGDATANDGIYTLAMDDTQYEGSYVFRFRANGQTSDGAPFARVHEVATYVGVQVDPGNSVTGAQLVQTAGNIVTQQYYVIPRDRRGEYFGPGYPDRVRFEVAGGGATMGNVIDHHNGIYSQLVRHDRATDRPVVTPVVDGVRIDPVGRRGGLEVVLPFVAYTIFDNSLRLEDGIGVGARLGLPLRYPQFTLEAEGAVTFTELTSGTSGKFLQALGNLRWDFQPLAIGAYVPHLTAGIGYAWVRDFGIDDEGVLYQGGAGITYRWRQRLGFRADARAIAAEDVFGSGSTTNFQGSLGLVWRF